MDLTVESKLEYTVDSNILSSDILDNNDNNDINNEDILIYNINKNTLLDNDDIDDIIPVTIHNSRCFFTSIYIKQIIDRNRDEYNKWYNDNNNDLINVYILLKNKYFDPNNIVINYNSFTEFIYLYY
jgi:hypothetical protein